MPLEGKLIRRRQDATIVTKKSENDSAASVGNVGDSIRPNCSMHQLLHFVHQKHARDRVPCQKKYTEVLTFPKSGSFEKSWKIICCGLLLRQTCQLRRKYAAGSKARWIAAENEKDGYLGQSLKTCKTILHLFGDRNVQCCKVCQAGAWRGWWCWCRCLLRCLGTGLQQSSLIPSSKNRAYKPLSTGIYKIKSLDTLTSN